MNKYERLFTWTIVLVLIMFTIGTCNLSRQHSDDNIGQKVLQLEHTIDSLNSIIDTSKSKTKTIIDHRETVKIVYKEKIKYVHSLDSAQQEQLFDTLFAGKKDSANATFYHNEQCQKELADCDSINAQKDITILALEQKADKLDSIGIIHKKTADQEKNKRGDDAYSLYLWKSIGKGLIAVDALVLLTLIALH